MAGISPAANPARAVAPAESPATAGCSTLANSSTNNGTPPVRSCNRVVKAAGGLVGDHTTNHFFDLTTRQAGQREGRLVVPCGPWRAKLRTECEERQHAVVESFTDELAEKLQRRGVRPLQVLDHQQDWTAAGGRMQPFTDRAQCLLACAYPETIRVPERSRCAGLRATTQTGARARAGPGRYLAIRQQALVPLRLSIVGRKVQQSLVGVDRRMEPVLSKWGEQRHSTIAASLVSASPSTICRLIS